VTHFEIYFLGFKQDKEINGREKHMNNGKNNITQKTKLFETTNRKVLLVVVGILESGCNQL